MGKKLFSDSLTEFTGEISNTALSESIGQLGNFLGKKKLKIFQWDEDRVALPMKIPVDLPPLGNFDNIDIRANEPILIVVDLSSYPTTAPVVFPDRLDFPKNNLAHLYVAKKGKPPAICLVRGGLADWYSNKKLKDLYVRIGNWMRDAASGQLAEDGDQFDPIRLEGYVGTMIYDYDQLAGIVNGKKSFNENTNFTEALFERTISESRFAFKLTKIVTAETLAESIDEFKKEREKSDSVATKKNYHFGYILWSETENTYSNYSVNFPDDWNSFRDFCSQYGISTVHLEKQIAENDQNVFVMIPVVVAIRRPKKIIGFSADIEFANFTIRVDTTDVTIGTIVNNVPVAFYEHAQPLSRQRAKQISGSQVKLGEYSLIAGCGALGSKIVMHFARSGATSFFLADPDNFSPHNLVRHALMGNAEGQNKAAALKKEIANFFPYEKLPLLLTIKSTASGLLDPGISKFFTWILDFTASNAFALSIIKTAFDAKTRIAKAFITDFGNLGIIYFEGKNRNPRIDDLQIMLYAQYGKASFISSWLQREADNSSSSRSSNLSITVGVGCNSETTVLSDDIVSLHASYVSNVIKAESQDEQSTEGKVYVNEIKTEPFFSNFPHLLIIPPMDVFTALNDPSWQVRMKPGIIEIMKKEMGLAMPSETGGVFVGCANYKTKTIHVTDLIQAPADSKANPVCFFRGVKGLPEAINDVNESTGNQLGYIGEWHTHPFGPNGLSATDANTIKKFKKDFSELQTPLPVFLMIITPEQVLTYIY